MEKLVTCKLVLMAFLAINSIGAAQDTALNAESTDDIENTLELFSDN